MEPVINKIEINPPKEVRRGWLKWLIVVPLVLLLLVAGLAGLGYFLILKPGLVLYQEGTRLLPLVSEAKEVAKTQDISKIKESLSKIKSQSKIVGDGYQQFSWAKNVPYIKDYYLDGERVFKASGYGMEIMEIAVSSVEPYTDLLGLKGKGSFTGGTGEDRIVKAVETLDKITPQIDLVAEKFELLKNEVDAIDPNRYPEEIQGKKLRSKVIEAKALVDLAGNLLASARPMIKKLPEMLGVKGERKYLVLFQNDAELRPTGGFTTAYAVFRIEKGRINVDTADDIYKLDETVTKRVAPPEAIRTYLKENIWHLRNANFSPDFPTSMRNFLELYNSSKEKKKIDGIIAMDTNVLVEAMKVIGPINAYGTNFTTEKVAVCDCPMVIWELEKYADEPKSYLRGSRKDIIGVLLSEMMKKILGGSRQVVGPLAQTMLGEVEKKHILAYLLDADSQQGVKALNAGGEIASYAGDYLHINDANLGGAKSNLYIVQSVNTEVKTTTSGTETKLVIEYRHTRRGDNCSLERKEGVCLSGTMRDYVRIYLPGGSELIDARGYESKNKVYSDLGKTVVDGFFTLTPLSIKKLEVTYRTPVKVTGTYNLLIQKQPGTDGPKYKLSVNGKKQEFVLDKDKEISIKL